MSLPSLAGFIEKVWKIVLQNSKRERIIVLMIFGWFSASILFIIYLSFPSTAFEGRKRGAYIKIYFISGGKGVPGFFFFAGGHFPSLYIW